MIRLITKRRLAALTSQQDRAEARVSAVQRRLARVKGERDELLRDFDARAVLVQERAARLEDKTRSAEQWAQELSADLTQVRGELTGLRRVEGWLQEAVWHLVRVAEAPVEVIVRDGVVHGVERSPEAARQAVRNVDPSATSWSPATPETDLRVGWAISTQRMPRLTDAQLPPHADELAAHYWPEDRRETGTTQTTQIPPAQTPTDEEVPL
jgi:hypothetical protein